jgi:hypothetical protein
MLKLSMLKYYLEVNKSVIVNMSHVRTFYMSESV